MENSEAIKDCSSKSHESTQFHAAEETERTIKEMAKSFQEKVRQKVNLDEMKVKLAQLSSQCTGLLSPEFFLNSPGISTPGSSKDSISPSNVSYSPSEGDKITSVKYIKSEKMPFSFPKATAGFQDLENSEILADELVPSLERVEILDDDIAESNEPEWEECHQEYIEQNNFRLGIHPGKFYKNKTHPLVHVKLPHRANYEVRVTNNSQALCHLDLYVDGKPTNALVLRPEEVKVIDGPAYSKYAFKIFRSDNTPFGEKENEGDTENGIVKAVFTPKREGRLRSVSEPYPNQTMDDLFDILDGLKEKKPRSYTASDKNKLERSLDISQVREGVTLLQGRKKKRRYIPAPEVEVDESKRVILQLKVLASLVEEVDATEEDVHVIEPPAPSVEEQD